VTVAFSRWEVAADPPADAIRRLAEALHVPPTLARLLVQRGHGSVEDARTFLRPTLDALSDPLALPDMAPAVATVAQAVRAGSPILVHGDYDVDGQCGTALLTRVLREAGATVVPFLPNRMRDGYDLGPAGLAAARTAGAGLIITCDCGTTALETVAAARAAGLRVVITDHHLPGELPAADAIVNPRRGDRDAPWADLCGTGVAFKLAQALVPALGLPAHLPLHVLDLVALATIADVVPLTGENRVLARFGLRKLQESRWTGLKALIEVAGLQGRPIRAGHVAFALGPRLNAAGRIGEAMDGLALLLSDDPAEALERARRLETQNAQRQELDQRILQEAVDLVERDVRLDEEFGLVLASDTWHPGVIGIVASRVVERYARPAILIALEGNTGKGSGRSIPGFDLHAAIAECSTHLLRFGGHPMAAGVTVARDALEGFRAAFNAVARARLAPEDLVPRRRIDAVVRLDELNLDLERLLRHLEPCGAGNPTPVFGVTGVAVREARPVGANHLRLMLQDDVGRIPAIGFDWADRVDPAWWRAPVDVAFQLQQNEWRGDVSLQARIVEVRPSA
jgi:single-stranded-DNA-specific exonuclease